MRMNKTKVNAPIKSGINKKYAPVESFIKGKRINFDKLLSDKGFNESLTKDIRAYNERQRYNAKKTGSVPEKFKPSDIKKQLKTGIYTPKEFRAFVKTISTGGYNKERKDFGIPTTPKEPKKRGPKDDIIYKNLQQDMIDKYGQDYFTTHEKLLKEYKKNLKKVEKAGIEGVETNFSERIDALDKNLNKIERENVFLKEVLKTNDREEALKNIQKREVEAVNKRKTELLRDLVKDFYSENPLMQAQVKTADYDTLKSIYQNAMKSVRARDIFHKKYPHPNMFNLKEEKENPEFNAVLTSIGGGTLKTSNYIDNFVRALNTLNKDGVVTDKYKKEILYLISKIPKDYLGDVLLDETIQMDQWYDDEDGVSANYQQDSRGKAILRGLKESALINMTTGNHPKWSKMYSPKELYELQKYLETGV